MFIPDPFKPEVIRFFDSPAGKAFLLALQLRKPRNPDAVEQQHTQLNRYSVRNGYEICLEEIAKIPQESQPQEDHSLQEKILLDPRD